ncbi:ATP-binding cassette subfamily F protein uup [Ereboglobus sp. PH5-10]|uniref:ATP-binding cassette domain-containing protein n=1 Tax=Ereboglobus sp. PH5-10 TaxID=2940629 RepID=UPI0024076FF0|nr:ATP-binding cassette domain-containing protein [Ereboglobus sp. PH5-10]MDF9827970.1 ATP-binding cassette subfamily F protein uup [Ereboglobus sp. PH5-10]
MALVNLLDINLAFGGPAVLENVNFQIDPGERVCLVGRNGSGKTTLMRVIAGEMQADTGVVSRQPGARFARLTQEIPADVRGIVHDIVSSGLAEVAHEESWERELRLEKLLERMAINPRADFAALSGGLKRRVLLARALASQPDLLLLDEPTNHLDLESILWLENFLLNEKISLFFVTHDRAFLRRLATRIVELDRGIITNWDCPYDTYLARRQERLEAEERQMAAADKKLAQEEEWARRKPSAQRKRSGARLEALAAMRAERLARRERTGNASMRLAEADRSGVKVVEAEEMSFAYPNGKCIIRDLTTTITRGDKIGVIGPNGSGKTTLIKLLLGELAPAAGTIKHGTNLEVVYFDQFRAQIDDDKTVADNIADGNTTVTIDGRQRHVITYLQDFLFSSQRARTPARVLSGGERNRLLLARLFTKPANVLVLDEPTNDLDAETLDLLENLLVEYQGTLLLVSHDRDFLDNVVTGTMVMEGDGRVAEYVGGYADYIRQRAALDSAAALRAQQASPALGKKTPSTPAKSARPRKLTNKENRELDELPAKIEALEAEQAGLTAKLSDPDFYKSDSAAAPVVRARLEELESTLAAAYARWEELETIRNAT